MVNSRGITKQALCEYIASTYAANAEHLWPDYPEYAVFRNGQSKKWFATYMVIPPSKLGLLGEEPVAVCNVKAEPLFIDLLLQQKGVSPAYHMNKTHWVTLLLSGGQTEEQIKALLDMSYHLTLPKVRKKAQRSEED